MRNEEIAQEFRIVWHGGMKDIMLCPDPYGYDLELTDGRGTPSHIPSGGRRLEPSVGGPTGSAPSRRDRVRQAVPWDRWVTAWRVATAAKMEYVEVVQELRVLVAKLDVQVKREAGRARYRRLT